MKLHYACKVFFALFCISGCVAATAQEISLPAAMKTNSREFSSLAWWDNKILLVPQRPYNNAYKIFVADPNEVSHLAIQNIAELFFDPHEFSTITAPLHFDGIEATVVIGNTIYFAIETKKLNAPCYIIKGTINDTTHYIDLDQHALFPLPKPKDQRNRLLTTNKNAGFESLVYLESSNELLAIFETKNGPGNITAYKFSTDLQGPRQNLSFGQSIPVRITDITQDNQGNLFAANFNDVPNNYKTDILKLTISGTVINTQVVKTISQGVRDNWEGILWFNGGLLMTTDGSPCSAGFCTKIAYFAF